MNIAAALRRPSSYYNASVAVELAPSVPLTGEVRADVCVVGGGVTGCSAALHLAERGYRVVLLEAGEIGHGASGRSGGQILPGLGTDMPVIEKALGREMARRTWELSRESVRLTQALIERHAIPCDLAWGYLHVALKPRHVRAMRRHQAYMAEVYDYSGETWLDAPALREHVVTDAYLGGLFDREGGHLHPLNYTLGLARAAQQAGVVIHEHSPAIRIEQETPATVVTVHGRVKTDYVVIATNAYLEGLVREMSGRIMKVANYIIATEPLSDAQVAQVLPRNDAVSDANFVLDYYRLSADHRLLYGGEVSYSGREPRGLRARMEAKMARLFPALEGVRIDYRWGGDVAITRNRAPDFGWLGSNIVYAQGYSGHGMSLAGLAGQLMAESIAGQAERFDVFAAMRHQVFPGGERLRIPLLVLATQFYRLRDLL
ncbi:NAD(P)/FAD-dependent oxidoreductase [Halomonas sp. WWR20]